MKSTPVLPDLTKLTPAQKDELIIELWKTLQTMELATNLPQPPYPVGSERRGVEANDLRPSLDELRAQIAMSAPSKRKTSSLSGRYKPLPKLEFLASKFVLWTIAVVGLGFVADFGIGWYERRVVDDRQRAALELRNAAFSGLYIELLRVSYMPDGKSYQATLNMQNTNPIVPLYVMLDPIRVFAQVGMTWREVASSSASESSPRLIKLDGAKEYSVAFQADLKDWAELIPGYMHIRIQSDMLISQSSAPEDDIVTRNNRFYVYLKPQGSDDAVIKRKGNFAGPPPIFIPMPPH